MTSPFDPALASKLLSGTPPMLRAWLADLPEGTLHKNEGGETWSPFDIVGHLVHGEKTDWVARAEIMLGEGADKRFPPFDRHAQNKTSEGKSITDLLNEFATLRAANVKTLQSWNLDAEKLQRTGIHPEFGEVTLSQHLSTWIAHDQNHIAQIARVLAFPMRELAGPWNALLPILRNRE